MGNRSHQVKQEPSDTPPYSARRGEGVGQGGWCPCHATVTGPRRVPPETQGSTLLSAHPGDMKGRGGGFFFFLGHTQVLTTMNYYLAMRNCGTAAWITLGHTVLREASCGRPCALGPCGWHDRNRHTRVEGGWGLRARDPLLVGLRFLDDESGLNCADAYGDLHILETIHPVMCEFYQ